jgi:hypothetical protein
MSRGRSWRRGQAERKFHQVRRWKAAQHRYDYGSGWDGLPGYIDIFYQKRNSLTETIEVTVRGESHFRDFIDHKARKARDNPKGCSCWMCCNPRNQGIGNARAVLSLSEGISLNKSIQDFSDSKDVLPNSKWRKRKYGKSTH